MGYLWRDGLRSVTCDNVRGCREIPGPQVCPEGRVVDPGPKGRVVDVKMFARHGSSRHPSYRALLAPCSAGAALRQSGCPGMGGVFSP